MAVVMMMLLQCCIFVVVVVVVVVVADCGSSGRAILVICRFQISTHTITIHRIQ